MIYVLSFHERLIGRKDFEAKNVRNPHHAAFPKEWGLLTRASCMHFKETVSFGGLAKWSGLCYVP